MTRSSHARRTRARSRRRGCRRPAPPAGGTRAEAASRRRPTRPGSWASWACSASWASAARAAAACAAAAGGGCASAALQVAVEHRPGAAPRARRQGGRWPCPAFCSAPPSRRRRSRQVARTDPTTGCGCGIWRNPGSSGQSLRRGPTGADHRPRDTRRPHRRRPLPVGGGARPGRLRRRLHRPRQRLGRGGGGQGVQPGRGARAARRPRGPHRPASSTTPTSTTCVGVEHDDDHAYLISQLVVGERFDRSRADRRAGGARDRRRLRRARARPRARRRAPRRQAREHPGRRPTASSPDRLRHRPGRGRPRADRSTSACWGRCPTWRPSRRRGERATGATDVWSAA